MTYRTAKEYTLILKDDVLPRDSATGREQASVSWEYNFRVGAKKDQKKDLLIFVPWSHFKPTYRGKDMKDVDSLDTQSIKRLSLMCRRCAVMSSQLS